MSQTQTKNLTEWQYPQVFAINKEPMRASFYSFWQDPKRFISEPWAFANYLILNGQWQFKYSVNPRSVLKTFISTIMIRQTGKILVFRLIGNCMDLA